MSRGLFCRILLIVIVVVGILGISSIASAQGRSEDALEHVRAIQERNTERLMALKDVEGTAIGLDRTGQPLIAVLTARAGVAGIPRDLEGVPVHVVHTGKFYALQKPYKVPPGLAKKDRTPPLAPTNLTADAVSSNQINLDWNDNKEEDLSHYNVYRSTSGGPYSKIASISISAFPDDGLMPSTTYSYVVTAVDTSNNESSDSNPTSAETLPGSGPEPVDPTARFKRPVPIGVSTGNEGECSAGTIGCRVVDEDGNVYALSNNHVYALENDAPLLSEVLQPGLYDTQCVYSSGNVIGYLAAFEPIVFHPRAYNRIDAAIAISSTDNLDNKTPSDGYLTPSSTLFTSPYIGLAVQKYGRTTGLTSGAVAFINTTVKVGYSSGTARFVGQIVVSPGTFSDSGDSGSLIVTQQGKNPVGLLFAGSSSYTIANPIGLVLDTLGEELDITLWIDGN